MNLPRNPFVYLNRGRLYPNYWDIAALLFVIGLIAALCWNARQMVAPYALGDEIPISLAPSNLPGYALRTVTRMLIALFFSLVFTFVVGTWAAKSKRARLLIIPAIDVCQSMPVLTFLWAAIVAFIGLFPGSLLGPECAAIVVIFTSQVWNMTLGFYQTMRAVPIELHEAADMFHLSAWQRFWRIEVPYSMPGLLWNTMLSMSASWFFVVACEAISVSGQNIMLPGIGSYIKLAVDNADKYAMFWAIFAMFIVILIYDQILFRPLVVWSEKFKPEQAASDEEPSSWVANLLQRTRLLRKLGIAIKNGMDSIINFSLFRRKLIITSEIAKIKNYTIWWDRLWNILLFSVVFLVAAWAVVFIDKHLPWVDVVQAIKLGIYTTLRVFACIFFASVIWVPIGVWVGFRPKVAAIVQPVAQFLAAFPANLIYPIATMLIVYFHLNVNIWVTLLMMLGVQWYILFNVIAGASVLPKSLLQAVDNFGVVGSLRWKRLIIPGILPYYVTGAITSAGGAWNASILAEVISWGQTHLSAVGLGSYISNSTDNGDFLHMALGSAVMCVFVLLFNRFLWRPLYNYADNRFQLDA